MGGDAVTTNGDVAPDPPGRNGGSRAGCPAKWWWLKGLSTGLRRLSRQRGLGMWRKGVAGVKLPNEPKVSQAGVENCSGESQKRTQIEPKCALGEFRG